MCIEIKGCQYEIGESFTCLLEQVEESYGIPAMELSRLLPNTSMSGYMDKLIAQMWDG